VDHPGERRRDEMAKKNGLDVTYGVRSGKDRKGPVQLETALSIESVAGVELSVNGEAVPVTIEGLRLILRQGLATYARKGYDAIAMAARGEVALRGARGGETTVGGMLRIVLAEMFRTRFVATNHRAPAAKLVTREVRKAQSKDENGNYVYQKLISRAMAEVERRMAQIVEVQEDDEFFE
jgi:hypothetical protein